MPLFSADPSTCNRDGLCAAVCPMRIIAWEKGELPVPVKGAAKLCIRCGHCVAVCPTASLHHGDQPLAECPPLREEWRISAEQCGQFLRGRRSIRNFRDTPVPRERLQQLIEVAGYAPSGHNRQGVRWLVVERRAEIERLLGIMHGWFGWMLEEMPQLARAMHLEGVLARVEAGEDVVLRGAPALILAHGPKDDRLGSTDGHIALAYLELAATGFSLGACWAGYFNAAANGYPPLAEALGLPAGDRAFGTLMLGHPRYRYRRLPRRNPPLITWR